MFVKWGVYVSGSTPFLIARLNARYHHPAACHPSEHRTLAGDPAARRGWGTRICDTATLPLATPASTERSPGTRCASRVGHPLWGEDGAVADLVFLDAGDGGVGILHGEAFGDGLDVVAGGDLEHLAEGAG